MEIDKNLHPYLDDEKYRKLYDRFVDSDINDCNEFIVSEVLNMYKDLEDDDYELKIKLLELLKGCRI